MDGWEVLAQGREGIRISRCPGGHIHLDVGNLSLRFTEEGFRAFAATAAEAAAKLGGSSILTGLTVLSEDEGMTFSRN